MIDECMAGSIDHVITKSISRFARNTLDCLKYIRQLKEKNIPVFFEKENINTMDSKGEVLLTIMASLAQQESQFTRDQANKVTLANIDAANREKLMQLEAGYKQDIASNDNISRAWGTMMESIDRIQTNGDLDPSTKQTLISNTQASFQSFANFWKKVGGGNVDVSDLLTFGPQNGAPVNTGGNSQGSTQMPNVYQPGSTQMPNVYQPDYSATQWGG